MDYSEGLATGMALQNGNGNGNGANAWNESWLWVLVIFALAGFGGNGLFGSRGAGQSGAGVMDGYVLTSDFANIERKLDNVNNGLCDGFYAMNTGMLNGFSSINQNIMQSGYETRNAIAGVASQLANCCCELKGGQKDTQYAIAMQTNAIQQSLSTGFRDIVDNANANYRALHDELIANRIEDKNAQIVAQQNEINALRLKASQEAQNAYLVNQLRPCPSPAYVVPNPFCCNNTCGTGTCGSII